MQVERGHEATTNEGGWIPPASTSGPRPNSIQREQEGQVEGCMVRYTTTVGTREALADLHCTAGGPVCAAGRGSSRERVEEEGRPSIGHGTSRRRCLLTYGRSHSARAPIMWRSKASAAPLLLARRAGYSAPSASDRSSDAVIDLVYNRLFRKEERETT